MKFDNYYNHAEDRLLVFRATISFLILLFVLFTSSGVQAGEVVSEKITQDDEIHIAFSEKEANPYKQLLRDKIIKAGVKMGDDERTIKELINQHGIVCSTVAATTSCGVGFGAALGGGVGGIVGLTQVSYHRLPTLLRGVAVRVSRSLVSD